MKVGEEAENPTGKRRPAVGEETYSILAGDMLDVRCPVEETHVIIIEPAQPRDRPELPEVLQVNEVRSVVQSHMRSKGDYRSERAVLFNLLSVETGQR